jgi:uncharacterized protein (TIGR02996 family)
MNDAGFLTAIATNPSNAGTRLAYADYLQEHGEPLRADVIRVSEEMRRLAVFSDDYWRLKARRNELRLRCPADWLATTGYDGSRYDRIFRDGFSRVMFQIGTFFSSNSMPPSQLG